MSASTLINKLIEVGAVEKDEGMLSFSSKFAGYLIWTVGTSQLLDTTVGDWKNILTMFDPSLKSLSCDEVADAVLLFDYYLNHAEMAGIEN